MTTYLQLETSSGFSNSEGKVLASELEGETREEIGNYKMGMIELRGLFFSNPSTH